MTCGPVDEATGRAKEEAEWAGQEDAQERRVKRLWSEEHWAEEAGGERNARRDEGADSDGGETVGRKGRGTKASEVCEDGCSEKRGEDAEEW